MKKFAKDFLVMAVLLILLPFSHFGQSNPTNFQVTVYVTLSTGFEPINVRVEVSGIGYMYTDSSGRVVFDAVSEGFYDISAFKTGFDTYVLNNIFINEDKVFNIMLSEKKYPPTCLYVDPLTLEATWCEPLRTALDENFEDPEFPPAGWQALSEQIGWERTDNGSSGGWTIPPWDSYYAMTNDDAVGGGPGDGCCDYLITPAVDLRESEDYTLTFDSFYNGAYGQLAFVEYSTDAGENWEVYYELLPASGWTNLEIDLGVFCGNAGPPQVWFAFHADDAGIWASGWAIDNVKIQVPETPPNYIEFWVYLDTNLVGLTTETTWNFAPLMYGQTYTASVAARYTSGLSAKDYCTFSCEYLFPPDSLSATAPDDAAILVWDPPWEYWPEAKNGSRDVGDVILEYPAPGPISLDEPCCPPPIGQLPENLLGYNIYRDGAFRAFTPHVPPGEYVPQGYVDEGISPGMYFYTVTAVYDLAPYGFPGETDESMEEGPAEITSCFCLELDFMENWDMGTFEDNNWTTDSANWSVNSQYGNPSPAAEFTWDPVQADYSIALESYPITALGMTEGKIWFDFDLKLDAVQPTGEEMLQAQVWNWEDQVWSTVSEYSNAEGSFGWTSEHININPFAMNKVFQVRFLATGVNSMNILSWFVDNIHIYRMCDGLIGLLTATAVYHVGIVLNFTGPDPGQIDEWIHWDDGVNSGNSIGNGSTVEFDAAARWEPDQLVNYEGTSVTQIAFFPAEAECTYNVRVWIGSNAANLVVDQNVPDPLIGQWNYVTLATPVPVDITQELWVGYYVNALAGYPAGVDDGPAIDGYGNMINFGGWQTLLQINPDQDCNWNIAAYLSTPGNGSRELMGYNLYREVNGGGYVLIEFLTEGGFVESYDNLIPGTNYCYMVTAVWESETDQCESAFSNEACALWTGITDNNDSNPDNFSLYPNPADNYVFIKTTGDLKRITVYNALGQLVVDEIATGQEYELATAIFCIGVYLVRVETEAGVTTRTLTIQR